MTKLALICEELTPQVMAKMMQDVIAALTEAKKRRGSIVICTTNTAIKKNLKLLDVTFSNDKGDIAVVYKTGDTWPEFDSDGYRYVIQRDLSHKIKPNNLQFGVGRNPPLMNDERYSTSNLSRLWNHQNGFCPPDAAMIMMWGPVKA